MLTKVKFIVGEWLLFGGHLTYNEKHIKVVNNFNETFGR